MLIRTKLITPLWHQFPMTDVGRDLYYSFYSYNVIKASTLINLRGRSLKCTLAFTNACTLTVILYNAAPTALWCPKAPRFPYQTNMPIQSIKLLPKQNHNKSHTKLYNFTPKCSCNIALHPIQKRKRDKKTSKHSHQTPRNVSSSKTNDCPPLTNPLLNSFPRIITPRVPFKRLFSPKKGSVWVVVTFLEPIICRDSFLPSLPPPFREEYSRKDQIPLGNGRVGFPFVRGFANFNQSIESIKKN